MKRIIKRFIIIGLFVFGLIGAAFAGLFIGAKRELPYMQAGLQTESSERVQTEPLQKRETREGTEQPSAQTQQEAPSVIQMEQETLPTQEPQQEGLFYYMSLSGEEQKVYCQIYEAIVSRQEISLSTLDTELAEKLYQCVMNDHPELFFSSGYVLKQRKRNEQIIDLALESEYHMTETEAENNRLLIEQSVERILSAMPQNLDQYGQVKYIYEYLIANTDYVLGSENNQNICSVFITHRSVCQGYAKATQYLLRRLGFDVTLVFGSVKGENHVWNLVNVDGDYYYLDTTWGDAGYEAADGQSTPDTQDKPVNYDYLLITTNQLLKTNTIENIVPVPACISMTNNYYNREGLYFVQLDEAKLTRIFENAYAQGLDTVSFLCESQELFAQMKTYLIEEQHVFDYMHSSDPIAYSCNEDLGTFTITLQ